MVVKNKMSLIAITEHGASTPGTADATFIGAYPRAPRKYKNLNILWGCEANIMDVDGTLDFPLKDRKYLDILLMSIHAGKPFPVKSKKTNTWYLSPGEKKLARLP